MSAGTHQWLTTAPNPRCPRTGIDEGQRGWVQHAVVATDEQTLGDLRYTAAACGLRPSHGWGVDLFIERKCARCCKKLGLPPPPEWVNEQRFKET